MKEEENEHDEVKLGAHSVDTTPINAINDAEDNDGHIPFEIQTEAVFNRLARDIYENDSAGIREPVTNAVSAILKASNMGYIDKEEGIIEIEVKESGNETRLKIRDNGIGMSMQTIKKIISVIGVSEARDIGELAGQFGMGFLAVFRLVGVHGGFEMSTNPRYTDEEPITGIWNSGGFTRDSDNMLTDGLGEDEYGTEFNFIVKQDIDRHKIRDWVSRYCEWARISVIYEETVDGSVEFEENYGGVDKNLNNTYDDNRPCVSYESEYFDVYTSPEAEGETILLDVPCKRSYTRLDTILGEVDIRLKNENGIVIKGPNEGYMVVSDGEYKNMDDERKDNYVPESRLTSDDIKMPQPVGTRRVLESESGFWDYALKKLEDKIVKKVDDIMKDINNLDDILSLDESEFRLICQCVNDNVTRSYRSGFEPDSDSDDARKWFDNNLEFKISDNIAKVLSALCYSVRHAEDSTNVSKSRNNKLKTPAIAVYRAYNNGGDIYMGCRLDEDKTELVLEDHDNNYVFEIDSTDNYEDYENLLGWKKLVDIDEDNIDEFDVNDELKEKVIGTSKSSQNSTSRKTDHSLNLHFKGNSKRTTKIGVEELEDKLKESSDKIELRNTVIENIVLFPSHKDKNISEYYDLCLRYSPMAKCRKKDWDRLKQYDTIVTIDELEDQSRDIQFRSSVGDHTLDSIENKISDNTRVVFHILPDEYLKHFEGYMSEMEAIVNERYQSSYDNLEYVYAPVKPEKLRRLHPEIKSHIVINPANDITELRTKSLADKKRIKNNTRLYAHVRLEEWSDTVEYNICTEQFRRINFHKGGYELVETIYSGCDTEGPKSQR